VLPTLWGELRGLLLRQVAALADPEGGYGATGSDWGRLEGSGLAVTFGEDQAWECQRIACAQMKQNDSKIL
jgi:hypothetical protein